MAFPPTDQWSITSQISAPSAGGIGDLWLDQQYLDFSDPTIRRKFINADKSWISLGQYGDVPTGTFPLVWNHVQIGGTPADFLYGYGQNGNAAGWQVVEIGVDPTTSASYPDLAFDVCPPPAAQPALRMSELVCIATTMTNQQTVSLRWSDTRGASWSNAIMRSLGEAGQYDQDLSWRRLGMARDRVFEISWSVPSPDSLTGIFLTYEICAT